LEALHGTLPTKISVAETYPNAYADANAVIASLALG